MNILVLYATTEGQTRKVAEHIAAALRERGHNPDPVEAVRAENLDPAAYDAAILAASVHIGRYQSALIHYARHWHAALSAMPSAFVSVSLAAASDEAGERAEVEAIARKTCEDAAWRPDLIHHAAGALRFTEYDFFKRWIMNRIARQHGETVDTRKDTEYTDWAALTAFVGDFLARAEAGRPA